MSNDVQTSTRCEVLVIGAGPTGLFAGILLKRQGIAVRIVDKSPTPAKESRAFALQARSLELLLFVDLAEAMLDAGIDLAGLEVFITGTLRGVLDFDGAAEEDTPHPFLMAIPQSTIELVLNRELNRLGVEVERGVEITSVVQSAGEVTASGVSSGKPVRINSEFMIGADGAHSITRHALNLSFEGAPYPESLLLADCKVQWRLDSERFKIFANGKTFGMYFPLKGTDLARVAATAPQSLEESVSSQGSSSTTLADVQKAFVSSVGFDVTLSDAVWTTCYHVHHRVVNRYRVDRVFVAGDAAHIHSPAGGQGMNTGLQDVANLVWKLNAVLRDGAPDRLLDTYDTERRPVAQKVLSATNTAFDIAAGGNGWETAFKKLVLPIALSSISHTVAARREMFHLVSQVGVRYDCNDFIQDWPGAKAKVFLNGPSAGHRVPDAPLNRRLDVFDLICGYKFTLLALSRKALILSEVQAADEGLRYVASTFPGLQTHLVARSLIGRDARMADVQIGTIFGTFGLDAETPQALYLVRPDGYLAWRAPGFHFEDCAHFLQQTQLAQHACTHSDQREEVAS